MTDESLVGNYTIGVKLFDSKGNSQLYQIQLQITPHLSNDTTMEKDNTEDSLNQMLS